MEVDTPQSSFSNVRLSLLPIEVLSIVFDHINLAERRALRLVCRQFKESVDYLVTKELVVVQSLDSSHRWYSTSQFADPFNFMRKVSLKILSTLVIPKFFDKLQRFRTNEHVQALDLIRLCNHLTRLRHLEIDHLEYDDSQRSLKLPIHLEVLVIGFVAYTAPGIRESFLSRAGGRNNNGFIDTSKIKPFKIINGNQLNTVRLGEDAILYIELSDCSTVRHLEFGNQQWPELERIVGKYVNVERLFCTDIFKLTNRGVGFLASRPATRELHLFSAHHYLNDRLSSKATHRLDDFYTYAADWQLKNNGPCTFYLQGIEMDASVVYRPFTSLPLLQLHYQHSVLLKMPYNQGSRVNYNASFESFMKQQPAFSKQVTRRNYFDRFYPYIDTVHINTVVDLDLAFAFVQSLRHISSLIVRHPALTKSFCDRLATLNDLRSTLNELVLYGGELSPTFPDLDFLFKFKKLNRLDTNLFPNAQAALELIQTLICPAVVDFDITPHNFIIRKKRTSSGDDLIYDLESVVIAQHTRHKAETKEKSVKSGLHLEPLRELLLREAAQ